MIRQIPNMLTLLNLFSGGIAVILAFNGFTMTAAWFILIGAYFDFTDGLAARLLGAYTEVGKQLDSLADLVTFGVAPAAILFQIVYMSLGPDVIVTQTLVLYVPILIIAFSALRLARFNVDEEQARSFKGLPTPANAILIASFPMLLFHYEPVRPYLQDVQVVSAIIVALSALLVAPLPMFSLKFKGLGLQENLMRYIFLLGVVLLIALLQWLAWPLIILFYILMSLILFIVKLFIR